MRVSVVCFALVCFTSTAASALDIKGVEVDKPVDCEQLKSVGVPSHGAGEPCDIGGPYITLITPFLDGSATMRIERTHGDVIKSVHVTGFDYGRALEAFSKKFGRPRTLRSIVQNGFGARLPQAEHVWVSNGVILQLSRHAVRIDEPSMFLSGKVLDAETEQKSKRSLGNI